MKTSAWLIVVLLLIFSQTCFGDGSSKGSYFNEYVNSPEGSVESSVNKTINPIHERKDKTDKNSVKEDSQPVLQGIPSKWEVCAKDSDCTAVVVDCMTWDPLNKKYLKELAKNLNSCSGSIDPGFQPETVCVNKTCKTTEKTTNVSWEEWLSEMRKKSRVEKGTI